MVKETVLFVGWGGTIPGREHQGLETYHEWISVLDELKSKGEIEDFQTFLLNPHGGELDGFTIIYADPPKLFELMAREDFDRLRRRALREQAKFSIIPAVTGELVEHEFKLLEEEVLPRYEPTSVGV